MKTIKFEVELEVPNNRPMNNSDDILLTLINFPHNSIY